MKRNKLRGQTATWVAFGEIILREKYEECIRDGAIYTKFQIVKMVSGSGSQPAGMLSPRRHLAVYGVILGCHPWTGKDTSVQWAEVRDAASILQLREQPLTHGLIGPRCPRC